MMFDQDILLDQVCVMVLRPGYDRFLHPTDRKLTAYFDIVPCLHIISLPANYIFHALSE